MKEIDGKAKNIRALLGGSKYAIDYYQREYKWQTKHISELMEDLTYDKKREHYIKQNLFAQSLHENAYDHNPGFKRFISESGLNFQAHKEFKKANLDARQELYGKLAEQIWSPARLLEEAKA